jgi:peptidoglycan/xylan/chitin deacetylase (PgdA/CDA1 family)
VSLEDWMRFVDGRGTLPERPVIISIDDGDRRTIERVRPILEQHGFGCTLFVVAGALDGLNSWERDGFPMRRLVGARLLAQLSKSGWEVGCHGLKHRRLPDISEAERTEETDGARQVLSGVLDEPVHFFAYPYGNVNRVAAAAVRNAGYAGACGSLPGLNHAGTNRFRMRRIFVGSTDGPFRFAVRVRFGRWHVLPWARWLVIGLLGRLRAML